MESVEETHSKLFPANEPDHELYTIPSYSSWFSWDDIHETERQSLKEFFNGSSISRTPKIYKEYRDFIINKYREDPSRRLKFTDIRKSLIGDVSLLNKVFIFLEKWGLINFGAPPLPDSLSILPEDEEKHKIVYEEGAPSGVRVVAFPNSSKPFTLPPHVSEVKEIAFRLPPLASYTDVFSDFKPLNELTCANCGEVSAPPDNESNKEENLMCSKCLKNSKDEDGKTVDDFKLKDSKDRSDNLGTDSWTDAETLLLLESILLHGDDWDLVAQNVRTKSKSDCIAKLIQLPFGELMLSTTGGKGSARDSNNTTINITEEQSTSLEPQKPTEKEDIYQKQMHESKKSEDGYIEELPQKRRRVDSLADASDSLMKQVARLSAIVSPHVAAEAAEAAITALCEENPYARMFIEGEGDDIGNVFGSPCSSNEAKRLRNAENLETGERHTLSETSDGIAEKNSTSVTLQIRTAIATAFGAAAAHSKLLADQEEREIEHLVATVIETQLRKLHYKVKHFDELQLIMEKEYNQIQELKESIVVDRIDVLQRVFSAGIPRLKDSVSVKSNVGNVV